MRALCAQLSEPQREYRSLHVVGTNGKSSVTAMTASLLGSTGLRTGACLSPHAERWSERTRIDGRELDPSALAAATKRVAAAIGAVEKGFGTGLRITQFEAAIATSFVAFADAGVDVAVIEAGLGGRLDATNVIPSSATALTSVGLDHTTWLGETEREIAMEKLAVLREGTALVLGELSGEVRELARSFATERGAAVIDPLPLDPELLTRAAPYLRRNAAVAIELAKVIEPGLTREQVADGIRDAGLPGRAQLLDGAPPLILDAAHNAQGAEALAEALPALAAGRPVVACVSVLEEKDAPAIAAALAPALDHVVCTAADPGPAMGRPGARALDAGRLAGAFAAAGGEAEAVGDPAAAIERALTIAAERQGVALCAGSHYLLRYAWTAKRAQNSSP